jgi:hypothetical protein
MPLMLSDEGGVRPRRSRWSLPREFAPPIIGRQPGANCFVVIIRRHHVVTVLMGGSR